MNPRRAVRAAVLEAVQVQQLAQARQHGRVAGDVGDGAERAAAEVEADHRAVAAREERQVRAARGRR